MDIEPGSHDNEFLSVHDCETLLSKPNSILNEIYLRPEYVFRSKAKDPRTCCAAIILYSFAIIGFGWIFLIIIQSIIYFQQRETVATNTTQCYCGKSIAVAISLGCKYDSMSVAWLPAHCRDDELNQEFESLGPGPNGTWLYWPGSDRLHNQVLNLAEVAALADDPENNMVRTSADWHFYHCFFYWRKLHRTTVTGNIVEPDYNHEGHIKHCGKLFKDDSRNVGDTRIWVRLGGSSLV